MPSSTPHWSKALRSQRKPCTATRFSYRDRSCPTENGVTASRRMEVEGRLPGAKRETAGLVDD